MMEHIRRRVTAATLTAALAVGMAVPASASTVAEADSWGGTKWVGEEVTAESCLNPARGDGFRAESYTVSGRSGHPVRLYMAGADSGSGSLGDPYLQVTDGRTVVAEDDDGGDGYDAYLVVDQWQDHYVLRATTYNSGETGTFTLHVGDGGVASLGADCSSPQSISFPSVATSTYGTAVTLAATATSGLPVTYSTATPDVCTTADGTARLVDVGTCTIIASQAGDDVFDPAPDVQRSFAVNPKTLSVTGFAAEDKVYDGTNDGSVTGAPVLNGVVDLDDVALSGTPTGTFAAADVGTHAVTVAGLGLAGADTAKYALALPHLSAAITARQLTVDGLDVADRDYDGSTDATLSGVTSLVGVVDGEDVVLHGTPVATLAAAHAGEQPYTVAGLSLAGGDHGNYGLIGPTGTATIAPKPLTVEGLTADSRFANGSTDAKLIGEPVLVGVVDGDDVVLEGTPTGTFDNAVAGVNRQVAVTGWSLGGASATDYSLTPLTLAATLHARPRPVPVPLSNGALPDFAPGHGGSVVDGQDQPIVIDAAADGTGLSARGSEFGLDLEVSGADGRIVTRDGDTLVAEIVRGQDAHIGGHGFAPRSTVRVWLFSEPRLLGSVLVDADGTFSSAVPVPEGLPIGEHTLQVAGRSAAGRTQALSVGVIVRGQPPVCATAVPSPFGDVISTNPHAANVDCIASLNVTKGTTAKTYSPARPMTRGQLASFVADLVEYLIGEELPGGATSFSDVAGTAHADAVDKLATRGIVNGFSATVFAPEAAATRAQVASAIARALESSGMPLPEGPGRPFADVPRRSVHERDISLLAELGIVAGVTPTAFAPGSPMRRDELATVWVRAAEVAYGAGLLDKE